MRNFIFLMRKTKKFIKNLNTNDSDNVDMGSPKFIGNVNREDFGTGYAGGVWDDSHISPTLTTMQGGGRQPHVITGIDKSYNNPKFIETANCITSREDRGVSDRKSEGTAVLETPNISYCLDSNYYKGTTIEQYMNKHRRQLVIENNKVAIRQATKQGYIEREVGGVADLSYPDSKTRRGRVQDNGNTCPTITATETGICRIEPKERFFKQALETLNENDCNPGDTINAFNKHVDKSGCSPTLTTRPEGFKTAILPVTDDIRIRKLTPKECFRLMGFSDENFDAAQSVGISNSQLYKQAGNSIVVDVLYYIYRELYIAMPYLFDDLKLSSFFSGIGAFERGLDRLYKDINSGNFIKPQMD